MKLAVISMTGLKPIGLARGKNSFSVADLMEFVRTVNSGSIIGDLNSVYDQFDPEGHGFITYQDLERAARTSKSTVAADVLENAFLRADSDGDGRVPFNDFIGIVRKGLNELGVFPR
jgi:Ca2+-binding EF-hand superfamily protein